jgi:transposase-like protein
MPRPDFPRTIFEFQERFATEEACLRFLLDSRWPDGFECPECGGSEFYWLDARKLMQCTACRRQTSVTAGTVMHRSKQPLKIWFWAAYLVTTHTPGISAVQLQRQTGIKYYETAFMMLHKLRAAMVKEGRGRLRDVVEVDESYFGGEEPGVSGRETVKKALVACAVEVRGKQTGRVRLRVVPNAGAKSLEKFVKENVEPGTEVRTDGWAGYAGLADLKYVHVPVVEGTPKRAAVILPHVHRVFANVKTWILGTHHGVSNQHLQAYLNEFTFRYNRRRTPMAAFQTVLGLIDERLGPTYDGLYGVRKGKTEYVHPNPQKRRSSQRAETTR